MLWLEIELSAVILYDVYAGEVKLLETCVGGECGWAVREGAVLICLVAGVLKGRSPQR